MTQTKAPLKIPVRFKPVRDKLVEGVEARFGEAKVRSGIELEFLSDSGGAFRAKHSH